MAEETVKDQRITARGKVLDEEQVKTVDKWMEMDRELMREEIRREVGRAFGKNISLATISNLRKTLGWTFAATRYCQLIRVVNVFTSTNGTWD
jgi:transposase